MCGETMCKGMFVGVCVGVRVGVGVCVHRDVGSVSGNVCVRGCAC